MIYNFSNLEKIDSTSKTGIYIIKNNVTGCFYVGSTSQSFIRRWRMHFSELLRDRHHSVKLQNSFNKHGESNFTLEILEVVENLDVLIEREQYWIDTLKPFYNINPKAGSCRGKIMSEKARLENQQRQFKQSPRTDSKTKVRGVSWIKSENRYRSTICVNKITKFLGSYNNIEDAKTARQKAEEYYFSQEFLNLSKEDQLKVLKPELKATNKSGFKNVYWSKKRSKWCVRFFRKDLGFFNTIEEAVFFRDDYNKKQEVLVCTY